MKRLFRFIGAAMILLVLAGTFVVGHYAVSGYRMYQEAVFVQSVQEKAEQIRSGEEYIALTDISREFLDELIYREDRNFYSHAGVDVTAVLRAAWHDLLAGSFVEGGSTITQQLAKNLYFSGEKEMERKVAELFVAFELERAFTKEEILELYCNVVYFGEGYYGIGSAAEHYYGVPAAKLDEGQAQALVYTLKCPGYYNPNARLAAQE
ncbi:MAG: transglycosylase domain-containing protein [Clostridium sp.]|nr:transglycosylase domain-containing protein [Clostridium sp.]